MIVEFTYAIFFGLSLLIISFALDYKFKYFYVNFRKKEYDLNQMYSLLKTNATKLKYFGLFLVWLGFVIYRNSGFFSYLDIPLISPVIFVMGIILHVFSRLWPFFPNK